MEFNLPNIYEEILQRSFEEEAKILKDNQLMSILLSFQSKDRIQLDMNEVNTESTNTLINNGYVRNEKDSFSLTQKGVNFLKLLGISSNYVAKQSSLDLEQKVEHYYNYYELLKLSKFEIFNYLSFNNKESNEFIRLNNTKDALECTLFLNCISNPNDFLLKLKSLIENDTKVILYYQNSSQRKNYLTKSKFLSRVIFPIVDLVKTSLKRFYTSKRKLKYLLFYNTQCPRAEVLGRIVYSGYRISEESFSKEYCRVTIRPNIKAKIPHTTEVKYSRLIKLQRIGKNERIIFIYKFRTMYPYSEFIQDYVYQINDFTSKGGFANDFRITKCGRFLRSIWLDELPMLINFFHGDLKLIGVRALSKTYLDLYPEDLRQLRSQFKPGLIPPFYVDLPLDMEGIFASERKYLESYIKRPWITDITYYFKATINILFKKSN